MSAPEPSTSNPKEFRIINEEDVLMGYGKETFSFLKHVLLEIAQENTVMIREDPLVRAQRYTGLSMNTIKELSKRNIKISKLQEINRKCVHDTLMCFYLQKKIMPTATELFDSIREFLPIYEDIVSFRRKLVKMGYIFRNIRSSTCNNVVVYEKPSIRFERFLYLKNIVQYKKNIRQIYYLSQVVLYMDSGKWNVSETEIDEKEIQSRYFFAVSPLGVQFPKRVEKFDKHRFNTWILNDVLPNLEKKSVVILENTKHHCDVCCETPNRNSSNEVMMEWLSIHEIPFTETMNSVELQMLMEKYTDTNIKLYKPDMWIKQNGHEVLRLPNCIKDMTPASHVRRLIQEVMDTRGINKMVEDIFTDIHETDLNLYRSMLAQEESRLFDLEIKLDDVIDNLAASVYVEVNSYLPPLSDSD